MFEQPEDKFEPALADLAAGRELTGERLAALTDLGPPELERFAPVWAGLDDQRKVELLDLLSDFELENARTDFNAIYHLGMADPDAAVRARAIRSTIEDTSAWLFEHLLELVEQDPAPEVRAAAAQALQPFAQRAELGELGQEDGDRLRRELLAAYHRSDERTDVRAAALEAVGYFSDREAQVELGQAIRDPALHLYALRGMGHSCDEGWLDLVLDEFEHPDERLRVAAASAAGEIGSEEAVEALTDLIDDESLDVRVAAIWALGETGGDQARESLVYALEDKREVIRDAAARAIELLDGYGDPFEA